MLSLSNCRLFPDGLLSATVFSSPAVCLLHSSGHRNFPRWPTTIWTINAICDITNTFHCLLRMSKNWHLSLLYRQFCCVLFLNDCTDCNDERIDFTTCLQFKIISVRLWIAVLPVLTISSIFGIGRTLSERFIINTDKIIPKATKRIIMLKKWPERHNKKNYTVVKALETPYVLVLLNNNQSQMFLYYPLQKCVYIFDKKTKITLHVDQNILKSFCFLDQKNYYLFLQ